MKSETYLIPIGLAMPLDSLPVLEVPASKDAFYQRAPRDLISFAPPDFVTDIEPCWQRLQLLRIEALHLIKHTRMINARI